MPLSADVVRQMAGYLIDQCIGGAELGGFITANFVRTLDYITNSSMRYDDPFRKRFAYLSLSCLIGG